MVGETLGLGWERWARGRIWTGRAGSYMNVEAETDRDRGEDGAYGQLRHDVFEAGETVHAETYSLETSSFRQNEK